MMELFSVMMINFLVTMMVIILSVAYVTLLERKVLGVIQLRLGPNKVGLMGVIQPICDGVKLLGKASIKFLFGNGYIYYVMPISMFLLMLVLWGILPMGMGINNYKNGMLLILGGLSLGVIPVMIGGWFSGSVYSMLGSVRSIAQMISYEVMMLILIMSFVILSGGFSMVNLVNGGKFIFMFPLCVMLFISILMELNRTPSDLIEGESELVSGFNTEYYGAGFALIFLGEYGMILFMGALFLVMVFGVFPLSMKGVMILVIYLYMVILIRGTFPRIRYDDLMKLCWVQLVCLGLGYLILLVGLNNFI